MSSSWWKLRKVNSPVTGSAPCIAATLNVLPDSVLKSKYRLKQKLGLDRETELTDFLASL